MNRTDVIVNWLLIIRRMIAFSGSNFNYVQREEINEHLKYSLAADYRFRICLLASTLLRGRVCIFVRLLFSPVNKTATITSISVIVMKES